MKINLNIILLENYISSSKKYELNYEMKSFKLLVKKGSHRIDAMYYSHKNVYLK